MAKYDFSGLLQCISSAQRIAIFTHVMPDGDALGSAFALRDGLRLLGKTADCFLEREVPFLYAFLSSDYLTDTAVVSEYDLKISVDCGEKRRLGIFAELFCGNTVNIDHHRQTEPFATHNLVDRESASTGEMIYAFLREAGVTMTKEIADALYAAVATDTGGFLFSNTTAETHRVAAALQEAGADCYELNKHLLSEKSMKYYQLMALCIESMELSENGKIAITYLDYDAVTALQITGDDLDGLSSLPRSIQGVEAGALLTELTKGKIKASLRSDKVIDVSAVAACFGGGGHIRASGFTAEGNLREIKQQLLCKLQEALHN